jgi:WD40 repeat protein
MESSEGVMAQRRWLAGSLALAGLLLLIATCSADDRAPKDNEAEAVKMVMSCVFSQEPVVLKGHTQVTPSVAFTKDAKSIVTATNAEGIKLWDAEKGNVLVTLDGDVDSFTCVAISWDGKLIAASGSNREGKKAAVELWDVEKRKRIDGPSGRMGYVGYVCFSPDATTVAYGNSNGIVKLWNVADKKEIASLKAPGAIKSLAFSADGKWLAGGCSGGAVSVWDVEAQKELHTYEGNKLEVRDVHFTPDGKTLFFVETLSNSYCIRSWEPETGKDKLIFETPVEAPIRAFALSADGRLAALSIANTGVLELRDIKTWKLKSGHEAHTKPITKLAFSHDGDHIASGGMDLVIKVWDARTLLEKGTHK